MNQKKMSNEHHDEISKRYYISDAIGKGTYSIVYNGMELTSNKKVAIKKIQIDTVESKHREQWKIEVTTLTILKHPNIISLVEYIDLGNTVYLILDHAGIDLHEYICRYNPTEDAAKPIFRQIVCGLAHIHKNMYAHRDVKLENTMIDDTGLVRLVDFAFAQSYYTSDSLYFVGSCEYLSPEILSKRKYDLFAADIWALGIMLYVTLYKKYPFNGNQKEICTQIRTVEPEYEIAISDDARNLLKLLLQKNAVYRPKIEHIMTHSWLISK